MSEFFWGSLFATVWCMVVHFVSWWVKEDKMENIKFQNRILRLEIEELKEQLKEMPFAEVTND